MQTASPRNVSHAPSCEDLIFHDRQGLYSLPLCRRLRLWEAHLLASHPGDSPSWPQPEIPLDRRTLSPPLFAKTIVAHPPGLPRSAPSRPTPGYRGCLRAIRLGRNLCCSISGAGFVSENLCALMASPLLQTPARAAPGARPGRNESCAEVFGSRRAASLYNTKRSPGDGLTGALARGFPSEQVASVEESPGGKGAEATILRRRAVSARRYVVMTSARRNMG